MLCAHRWEAEPFLSACQAKLIDNQGWLPFPVWRGSPVGNSEEVLVDILLTGPGITRAAAACSWYLAQTLYQRNLVAGSDLNRSLVVVANFGTAGAYREDWSSGDNLLVNRISGPMPGRAHYPERLLKTPFPEGECRSVMVPQTRVDPADLQRQAKLVFDMEAWGIAEVVAGYLSWAHLVVGKMVLDQIPHAVAENLDWRSLVAPHRLAYEDAAQAFLAHALSHLSALVSDPRRQAAHRLEEWSEEVLAFVQSRLHLSVTQQRELLTGLRAWSTGIQGEEAWKEKAQDIRELLEVTSPNQRHAHKAQLAKLYQLLTAAPVLPSVCGE